MPAQNRFEYAWQLLARIVSRPTVFKCLKKLAMLRPYSHIMKNGQLYMARYWLFNPYRKDAKGRTAPARWRCFPSIRLHYIAQADKDAHEHNHPWDARTIILSGSYLEARNTSGQLPRLMEKGDTATLTPNDFHRICWLSKGGVWTMFFTWKYTGEWAFMVDGEAVNFRQYLAENECETTFHPGHQTHAR